MVAFDYAGASGMEEPKKTQGWSAIGRRAAVWLIFLPVLIALVLLIYLFVSSGAMLFEAS